MAEATADPPPEGPRPALRRGVETRKAIDLAAVDLFFRLGYHATTMKDIAAACGVQAAAIYHWYPSKEALLIHLQNAFMRDLTRAVDAATARHDRAVVRLAAAVRAHVLFHALYRREAFVTDSEIRALAPAARAELVRQRDDYQALFLGLVEAATTDGDLRPTNARIATYAILLQCTGVALWFRPTGDLSAEVVADQHVDLVLASLHACDQVVTESVRLVRQDALTSGG